MKLPRIRLPRWVKISGALGALLFLAVGIPVWLWLFADIAPHDDSDLAVKLRVIAPSDNGFELVNFGEDESRRLSLSIDDRIVIERWQTTLVRDVVDTRTRYLDAVDAALGRPEFQIPRAADPDAPRRYLLDWVSLGDTLRLRARLALEDGRTSDAVDDAFRLIALGRRIAEGGADAITYDTGHAVAKRGLETLHDALRSARLTPSALHGIRSRLEPLSPRDEDVRGTLKTEYHFAIGRIDDLARDARYTVLGVSLPASPLYRPNESHRLVAEAARHALRGTSVPSSKRPNHVSATGEWTADGFFAADSTRNRVGRSWAASLAGSFQNVLSTYDGNCLAYRITLALVALHSYHAEHGELPDSFEVLVPKYLDAVPIDPYDGKPLRYSKAKRRIWSIGDDGVDAGGLEVPDSKSQTLYEESEPTLSIRFGGE